MSTTRVVASLFAARDALVVTGDPSSPRGWLTRNVLWLGVVSMLTDVSSEMVIPLLPAFLTVLGGGALALGWIEGAAEAVSSVLKLLSGRWADRARRNRPFVIAGYSLSTIARPLVALATAPWHVLLVRLVDRTGKGLRSTPRDALLAASVDEKSRGVAFGFHRAMDHAGAVIGPLLAFALLSLVTDELRTIFWLALLPGALAVAALVLFVRERAPAAAPTGAAAPALGRRPPAALARFLVPYALFTLGHASDTFLLLRAGEERAPLSTLPLLWVALHVVKSLSAVPGGWLADRFGRRPTIAAGWLVHVGGYVALALAPEGGLFWLVALYGLHHGLSEGAERALVADLVPGGKRGAGFGWYYLAGGLFGLAGSVLFGTLWDAFDSRTAFLTGAALGLTATVALAMTARR